MTRHLILASAAALALAACGGDSTNDMAADNMAMDNMALDPMANDTTAMNMGGAAMAANGQEYATMAAASDMYEIEAARIAREKSQNAEVRELAQMIMTDHQGATEQLMTAAQQAQPAITVTPAMNAEQQAMIQALQNASAEDFDGTYLQQQIMAHEMALAMVRGYAESGDVPSLRQHASTVAGPIQQHLERARALMESMAG